MSVVRSLDALPASPPRPIVHLIDADALFRDTTARLLRSAGHDVATYASPDLLVNAVPRDGGCIVLDGRLEGLSSQCALARRGHTQPVVFLASTADVPTTVQAMRNGAEDVLTKPVASEVLLSAVARALARDARQAAARAHRRDLQHRYATLSPAEREIFSKVTQGMLNKEIAAELHRSERTVKAHRSQVMRKMGANSLADLVRMSDQLLVPAPAPAIPTAPTFPPTPGR